MQVGELGWPPGEQTRPGCGNEHVLSVEKRKHLDRCVLGRKGYQAEVALAFGDPPQNRFRRSGQQGQVEAWVEVTESPQRSRQSIARGGGAGPDSYRSRNQSVEVLQFGGERPIPLLTFLAVPLKDSAGLG